METTGTADMIARQLLDAVAQGGPVGTGVLVLLVTMFLSDLINNAAAPAVMYPIAIGTAAALGRPRCLPDGGGDRCLLYASRRSATRTTP